jgi:hypothetical protein
LTDECPIAENAAIPEASSLRYTSVLTRQSGMFNAWKLLCELSDRYTTPIRLSSMASELELHLDETLKLDRKRRLNNLRLTADTIKVLT